MKNWAALLLIIFKVFSGLSQEIVFSSEKITIDGYGKEQVWSSTSSANQFTQNFPTDSLPSGNRTEVWLASDNENLYVFAKCYLKSDIQSTFVQTLKRDFNSLQNDAFGIFFDPYGDGLNGFYFVINALGAQTEAMIGNGTDVATVWDNKWYSSTMKTDSFWTAEFQIPFKSIRYNENNNVWRFNFIRVSLTDNERSTWVPVPINFEPPNLAFVKPLYFEKTPPKPKVNISIIPSLTTNISKNYQNNTPLKSTIIPSIDGKIAITPGLNLDLTVNPDFSQAEVDVQQTNLTRFELFFPERRQFFIENSDLFETFGFRQIRPFFSRRIGLNQGQPVPIIAGARLSGKLNKNWRVGLMNLQTEGNGNLNLSPQNYTVAAFQRKIFARSNIAGILVNRQEVNENSVNFNNYNRIAGLDYNIASADNKFRGKVFYHQSFQPNQPKDAQANASWLMYQSRNWFVMWNHEYVGRNYQADVGFVRRNQMYNPISQSFFRLHYLRLEPMIRYSFFPKKGRINRHGPEVYMDYYSNIRFRPTDNLVRFSYLFTFNNTSTLSMRYGEVFTKLFFPTDVSFAGKTFINEGNYRYNSYIINYSSDFRKDIQAFLSLATGKYYTGNRVSINSSLTYRLKPKAIFTMSYERNIINLPEYQLPATLNLLGVQADISFNTQLFFNTFIQYNSQINNVNLNTRLQWRFKPMSDLYLVYSENYDPFLQIKNRALVLKFIYWLTI